LKVVDTTFIIGLLRGDPGTIKKAAELDKEGGAATTSVNIFEVSYGVYRSMSDIERRLEESLRVFSNLDIFPLDFRSSIKAAEIAGTLGREGIGIDPFDALVAGVAISNGAEAIVTRNVDHFERIPGLKVEEH
jgi:predicted nucleic acid-binding protein